MDAELLDYLGFQEPGTPERTAIEDPDIVASATAMPAPKKAVTTVSGTTAITTIALPWVGFTGTIKYLPTGAFTGATGGTSTVAIGAIGLAFTAVVGKVLSLTYVKRTGLWYPDYVA